MLLPSLVMMTMTLSQSLHSIKSKQGMGDGGRTNRVPRH
jgi:hypothetical protein